MDKQQSCRTCQWMSVLQHLLKVQPGSGELCAIRFKSFPGIAAAMMFSGPQPRANPVVLIEGVLDLQIRTTVNFCVPWIPKNAKPASGGQNQKNHEQNKQSFFSPNGVIPLAR